MRRLIAWVVLLALAGAPLACNRSEREQPRDIRTLKVDVPGAILHVEETGSGPPLVLLHGGFGDRRMWDDQFEGLASSFRVVRYDQRGFGLSSPPIGEYSPAGDLVHVMDALGIPRAHLVGHSLGGTLALDFALLEPDRTDRVAVISSGASGFPYSAADRERAGRVFAIAKEQGTAAAARAWLEDPKVTVAAAAPDAPASRRLRAMVEENRRVFMLQYWPEERMVRPAYERLKEVKAAVLFVVGERDALSVQNAARATAERLPGARVEVVPGADHLPQMEEPERVNRILYRFLRVIEVSIVRAQWPH